MTKPEHIIFERVCRLGSLSRARAPRRFSMKICAISIIGRIRAEFAHTSHTTRARERFLFQHGRHRAHAGACGFGCRAHGRAAKFRADALRLMDESRLVDLGDEGLHSSL